MRTGWLIRYVIIIIFSVKFSLQLKDTNTIPITYTESLTNREKISAQKNLASPCNSRNTGSLISATLGSYLAFIDRILRQLWGGEGKVGCSIPWDPEVYNFQISVNNLCLLVLLSTMCSMHNLSCLSFRELPLSPHFKNSKSYEIMLRWLLKYTFPSWMTQSNILN